MAAVRRTAELQVLNDVSTDFTAYRTQRTRVLMLRDTYLPKAQSARDIVEYAYRRGGQSLLDFLDAQRSYRETALAHSAGAGRLLGLDLPSSRPMSVAGSMAAAVVRDTAHSSIK